MPKSSPQKLKTQTAYESTPKQVKLRVMRNKARREALAAGIVHKGDGLEIDHKKMLDSGGGNEKSNQRVLPAAKNRGWRKTNPKAYTK